MVVLNILIRVYTTAFVFARSKSVLMNINYAVLYIYNRRRPGRRSQDSPFASVARTRHSTLSLLGAQFMQIKRKETLARAISYDSLLYMAPRIDRRAYNSRL